MLSWVSQCACVCVHACVSVCVCLCRFGQRAQLRVMSALGLFYLQALLSWSQSADPNALMQEADGSLCLFFSSLLL